MSEIESINKENLLANIKWNEQGLIPAIVQDCENNMVLMLGYMNPASLQITFEKGLVTFWSRSRQKLWTKGETSGNHLQVEEILIDCDRDTLLIKAYPIGPTCHTGKTSCFSWSLTTDLTAD
jgi:phosphoribosyl-AMP cyclohydrolase / phosphoribosyl-ATP pyrophosphohydrolase